MLVPIIAAALLACAATASEWALVDHDDSYLYRLPYADAVSFPVIQSWGSPLSHTGTEFYTVDFRMPVGTPVHAARDGIVVSVQEQHERACWSSGCGRYANYVVIEHSDGTFAEYFHLQKEGVIVTRGEKVVRGQHIALSGNTGYTNTPHLHFGVYAPVSEGGRRSIDIRFVTTRGIVTRLRSGRSYRNEPRLSVAGR